MPCFNTPKYIERAVDSVLVQSRDLKSELQLIIVDDCSTHPDMKDVLAGLGSRLNESSVILRCDSNQGAAHARNEALAYATGRYIAFLDSDDVWQPGHLSLHISTLSSTLAGFSGSDYASVDEKGDVTSPNFFQCHPRKSAALKSAYASQKSVCFHRPVSMFIDCCPCWTGCVVVDRSRVPSSVLRFETELKLGEDNHFWIRLALVSDYVFTPRVTAAYRTNPQSLTQLISDKAPEPWHAYCLEALLTDPAFRPWGSRLRRRLAEEYRDHAYELGILGDRQAEINYLKRAWGLDPISRITAVRLLKWALRS
jgi:glycosyltransferase involved in cell wall biosynthesis